MLNLKIIITKLFFNKQYINTKRDVTIFNILLYK